MEKHLIRTILTSLASIGKVEYRIKDEFTGFYRISAMHYWKLLLFKGDFFYDRLD